MILDDICGGCHDACSSGQVRRKPIRPFSTIPKTRRRAAYASIRKRLAEQPGWVFESGRKPCKGVTEKGNHDRCCIGCMKWRRRAPPALSRLHVNDFRYQVRVRQFFMVPGGSLWTAFAGGTDVNECRQDRGFVAGLWRIARARPKSLARMRVGSRSVTEGRTPIRALQAALEGYEVVTMEALRRAR